MTDKRRGIKSFARRKGRIKPNQMKRLERELPALALPKAANRQDLLEKLGADPDTARMALEIGFGGGEFLAGQAARSPDDRFYGVEVYLDGVSSMLFRLREGGMNNVRLTDREIDEVLANDPPPGAFDHVTINFPDPWPKTKHHKRRIVQPGFLDRLADKMAPGGILALATDWGHYADHMLRVIGAHPAFENLSPYGRFVSPPADWITTSFEKKGRDVGRFIFHLRFRKRDI